MILEEEYIKETGKNIITTLENTELFYHEDYVEWLEKQLSISRVVGRSEQLFCKGRCDHRYNDEYGNELYCSIKEKSKIFNLFLHFVIPTREKTRR